MDEKEKERLEKELLQEKDSGAKNLPGGLFDLWFLWWRLTKRRWLLKKRSVLSLGESPRREQVQKKELLVLFPKERRQEKKGKATT